MADSDGEYIQDASDDEYMGGKSNHGTRAHGPGKRPREKVQKQPAWKRSDPRAAIDTIKESSDGTIQQSVQEREEQRKRKRLRKDTKPFQRGIIRHVALVLDISEAMLEKDMRPNRYVTMINFTQGYVREFFEQNPISQMCVLAMHDGLCIKVSELSGNPTEHISAIQALRYPKSSKIAPKEPKGRPSLQNALELARANLHHTPSHGTREVIIVFGALLTIDPGDIFATIKKCVQDRIRVSIIGMGARVKICTEIVSRTNAGDESEYVVATDQEHLRELLIATTTPSVIRSQKSLPGEQPVQESAAALMVMGFPSRIVEEMPTLCACHGNLSRGGYTCSRCKAKVCSLPSTCPSCHLTLLLSTHLARSYHHLFPLRNWVPVTWKRAKERGSVECVGCLSRFPDLPDKEDGENSVTVGNGTGKGGGRNGKRSGELGEEEEEPDVQKASESSRYECRSCHSHFCVDCDVFAHTVLHNCPGCLSGTEASQSLEQDRDGDVVMAS